jgi:hypothetical protein
VNQAKQQAERLPEYAALLDKFKTELLVMQAGKNMDKKKGISMCYAGLPMSEEFRHEDVIGKPYHEVMLPYGGGLQPQNRERDICHEPGRA